MKTNVLIPHALSGIPNRSASFVEGQQVEEDTYRSLELVKDEALFGCDLEECSPHGLFLIVNAVDGRIQSLLDPASPKP